MIKRYLCKGYHNLLHILLACMLTGCIPENFELLRIAKPVDLGLSVKWASCNVGASFPEDYGDYFDWGNPTPNYSGNHYAIDWSMSELRSSGFIGSGGYLTASHDAATVNWGSSWRMPTSDEINELVDKCTWSWTIQNGVKGYKVTGPNGNSIFLPAAGLRFDGLPSQVEFCGEYWSATPLSDSHTVYALKFDSDSYERGDTYFGMHHVQLAVRPVYGKSKIIAVGDAIDLGLSVKWATWNLGATAPEESGGCYSWGETAEKSDYSWSTYKLCEGTQNTMTKYCTEFSYGTVDQKNSLELEDDVAHVRWGKGWRMPTSVEFDELRNNCNWKWTSVNGVNGYEVTGSNGNSIFLPAAGQRQGTNNYNIGGHYWSSELGGNSDTAYGLCFDSTIGGCGIFEKRCYGYSVRPVTAK